MIWITVTVAGLFGGLCNALLVERRLLTPLCERIDGRRSIEPGTIGNMFLGMVAAFLVYCLGPDLVPKELLATTVIGKLGELRQLIGVCLLAGIGGGNVITSLMQEQRIKLEQNKTQAVVAEVKRKLEGLRGEQGDP